MLEIRYSSFTWVILKESSHEPQVATWLEVNFLLKVTRREGFMAACLVDLPSQILDRDMYRQVLGLS